MNYMLLIYGTESCWTEDMRRDCMIESMGICEELAERGQYVTSRPLQSVTTATSVRVRQGQTFITAGPFAETAEQLGGFYILNVDSLDDAIAVASRLPPAMQGTVEIRPIRRIEGLPTPKLNLSEKATDGRTEFLLLAYDDEQHWESVGEAAWKAALAEAVELTHELDARGCYLSAAPLHPISTATSVRVRQGRREITDGPFAETREVLGGYYLIRAKDQREAEAIAARHPGVRIGAVEVRQTFDTAPLRPFVKNRTAVVDLATAGTTTG